MDLLAQDFGIITFQDVVDFCDQEIVENVELDYEQVIPQIDRVHQLARGFGTICIKPSQSTGDAAGTGASCAGVVSRAANH